MKSTGRLTKKLKEITHYCYNKCSVCDGELPINEPAFAGYDEDNVEIYVGNCCLKRIHELGSHIYWWWTSYKRPKANEYMWRYIDFAKFVALLQNKSLYFSRADKFEDSFEGARGNSNRETTWKNFYLEFFKHAILFAPDGHNRQMEEEKVKHEAERLYNDFTEATKRELISTYINCWHASPVESEALWRIYGANSPFSVAIKTTFGRLLPSLETEFDLKFGHVNYIDFDQSFSGVYDRFFYKRKSLEYEKEVRGIISFSNYKKLPKTDGLNVSIDLNKAVELVVLSPSSPPWFKETVINIIKNYGFDFSVHESSLLAQPFY